MVEFCLFLVKLDGSSAGLIQPWPTYFVYMYMFLFCRYIEFEKMDFSFFLSSVSVFYFAYNEF